MKASTKWLAVAVALLYSLAAQADEGKIIKKVDPNAPRTDQEFLAWAINDNMAEVKFGEKAVKNASDKDVRKFAQTMIDDHTKQRDALLKQAKAMKMGVVAGASKEGREEAAKLSRLSGLDYDREYINFMVEGHEKALGVYETWAKKAKDSELRELAAKAVPVVKEHLRMARELQTRLKKS
jgi:putative membrane protein